MSRRRRGPPPAPPVERRDALDLIQGATAGYGPGAVSFVGVGERVLRYAFGSRRGELAVRAGERVESIARRLRAALEEHGR